MSSSLPIKFEGFEIEIQEKVSDLDRSNEASGIIQGKIIKWEMINRDDGDGGGIIRTAFAGEDEEGRLVFSGVDASTVCFAQKGATRELIPKTIKHGGVSGSIEMGSNQFGPGAKYKIALTVRARVIASIVYATRKNCEEALGEQTPCVLFMSAIPAWKTLGSVVSSPTIPTNKDGSIASETNVNLTLETEAIDFNSQFPDQGVKAVFVLVGQRISIDKVILSKKVF